MNENNRTAEEIKLKVSVIISATNTSGNQKLDAIMDLFSQFTPPVEGVEAIVGTFEYDFKNQKETYTPNPNYPLPPTSRTVEDAVGFAEFIGRHDTRRICDDGIWKWEYCKKLYTTTELYQLYTQSLTK